MKYKIADFNVEMNCKSKFMNKLLEQYITDETNVDFDLSYNDEEIKKRIGIDNSLAMFEYNITLGKFVNRIIDHHAFCFHSSCLSVDGEAILFSADSGTGKSTHARLWKEYMKDHHVVNLNDDKPIIRIMNNQAIAYGSPWSGKHSIHTNDSAPVKALIFLERGNENKIEKVDKKNVFSLLFPQALANKGNPQHLAQLLDLIDLFVQNISVYKLSCTISEEAVQLVYDTVWGK